MTKVLPILFNTEMVRAILDERKTVTRRVLKHPFEIHPNGCITKPKGNERLCPYEPPYQPGDILYVRETWNTKCANCEAECSGICNAPCYVYRADCQYTEDKWRPSIHMPKEAARIWLKVTDVRVERLQDITEGQAQVEGAVRCYEEIRPDEDAPVIYRSEDGGGYYTLGFKAIWNSTIKKSDLGRYGWNANPWVWVIEFERCEKPKGER